MKAISFFVKLFCLIVLGMFMGACSHNDLANEHPAEEKQRHTCKMTLIGGVNGFDGSKSNTKAVSPTWKNGDKIYLTFYNDTTPMSGEAVYDSSSGWTVSYDGYFAEGANQKCEARFFVNATLSDSYRITLNPNTEIYEDVQGVYTYDYSDGALTVQALLTPKTGRIRFTDTSGSEIYLIGITTYSAYSPRNNHFSTSTAMVIANVTNGSTPYIYGYFTYSNKELVVIGNDCAFTRHCTDAVLKVGESGYMAIPSESSHNNWRTGAYITLVNGTSETQLKMIPVAGHTDGFFLMAETETTEQVWEIVCGESSPSNSTLPQVNVYYDEVTRFIDRINNKTELRFSLPTEKQWQYAAKGGNKSQGYTYAGSNIPGDVAWYIDNTDYRQPVKGKAPNELGLYDMSGNVSEWTSTRYNINYSFYNYLCCGGDYTSKTDYIRVNSYFWRETNNDYCESDIGFRLILTCP